MFGTNQAEDYVILNYLHSQIMAGTGEPWGQRDPKITKSAVSRPLRTAFGQELYGDPYLKAAALLDAIVNRVVFKDGNKRTAMAAATLYLARNHEVLHYSADESAAFMHHVVVRQPPITDIAHWLQSHSLNRRLGW